MSQLCETKLCKDACDAVYLRVCKTCFFCVSENMLNVATDEGN